MIATRLFLTLILVGHISNVISGEKYVVVPNLYGHVKNNHLSILTLSNTCLFERIASINHNFKYEDGNDDFNRKPCPSVTVHSFLPQPGEGLGVRFVESKPYFFTVALPPINRGESAKNELNPPGNLQLSIPPPISTDQQNLIKELTKDIIKELIESGLKKQKEELEFYIIEQLNDVKAGSIETELIKIFSDPTIKEKLLPLIAPDIVELRDRIKSLEDALIPKNE